MTSLISYSYNQLWLQGFLRFKTIPKKWLFPGNLQPQRAGFVTWGLWWRAKSDSHLWGRRCCSRTTNSETRRSRNCWEWLGKPMPLLSNCWWFLVAWTADRFANITKSLMLTDSPDFDDQSISSWWTSWLFTTACLSTSNCCDQVVTWLFPGSVCPKPTFLKKNPVFLRMHSAFLKVWTYPIR